MNALKKHTTPKKRELELLAGGGGIERVPSRPWISVIFGFLFSQKSDLTLESWRQLEQKRGYRIEPAPMRDQHMHSRWHI